MKYFFFILFFFTSVFIFGQSQKKIDSLLIELDEVKIDTIKVDVLNKIFREYYFISKDSAKIYADLAFEKATQIQYYHGIQLSCRNIAALLSREANKTEELKILLKGAELLKKFDDEPTLIQIELAIVAYYAKNNNISKAKEKLAAIAIKTERLGLYKLLKNTNLEYAYIYHSEHDFEKAIKYYLKVDSIYEARKLSKGSQYGTIIMNIGGIKSTLGEFDDAIAYFNKAMTIYQKLNREITIHNIKESLGILEIRRKNYEKAELYLEDAYNFYTKNDYLSNKKTIVGNLADTYRKLKKYKKAEETYKEQYNLSIQLNDSLRLAESYIGLGSLNFDQKKFTTAVSYFEKAKRIAEIVDNTVVVKRVLNGLAESYLSNNNHRKAALTFKRFSVIQDSLSNLRNKKVTEELETKYQTDKKEQEIVLLKSEKELNEQKQKSQRNLLIGGLGLTTLGGIFLFVLFRNRKKMNTKLKELDALKSNFFANISHEFRTPLTLIASPIDDILENETISDKKRQQFTVAKQNSERLLELVNQLLDLSKIDAGHLKLNIQKGNALQLISALSDSFSYQAQQKKISYTIAITPSEDTVWFDKDAIEKITINLLSNSIKYTPENGSISCEAHIEKNLLFLEIKNSGKGLSEYELANIFERFYQTNDQNQGSGIGLALVKELVELHKGTIEVHSTPNEETSFNLKLAIDKNSFKNAPFLTNSDDKTSSEIPVYTNTLVEDDEEFTDSDLPILLIVEDNDDLRHLLKQTFENHYNVISASNGKIGVEEALEHIPDLIISDIMMPEKDGITLTNELKNDERSAHIPIILLTAKAEVESQFIGIDSGADDYITKPFDKKLLALKVEKLIASRRQLQERYSQELILLPKDIAITNLDEQFLEKVQTTLDKNLIEPSFNVTEFSEAVGMSRMQLHRKLKALTGLTASEFIRSQRLKLAAQLLKTSDINISQVGYSVGFNDHSYFAKCFKEFYKCTPTEYANRR